MAAGQRIDPVPPRPAARLLWQMARIDAIVQETPRIRSFVLHVGWAEPFRAGQYIDVRLTAPDGYQAQRSYSIASAPTDRASIEIMVEKLDDGEVSGFFHEVAEVGDLVELRGPIGLPFSWAPRDGGPLLLIGGGSGVVPLLSMLRHRAEAAPDIQAVLLYSARTARDVICRAELERHAATEQRFGLILALTRDSVAPATAPRFQERQIGEVRSVARRRVDRALIHAALARLSVQPSHVFLCGSNSFVGAVADILVDAGLPPSRIRTERFG